jgi:carbonic anhydrase
VSKYTAKVPFNAAHPDALAIYCSDGRFTDAVEELLHTRGHSRLDVVCVPGGPALLDLQSAGFSALEAMRSATSFLIRAHGTKHVVLVSHEGCGYYRDRYRFESPAEVVRQQHEDLRIAGAWLASTHAPASIALYFARPEGARVGFHEVALTLATA